MRPGYLECYEKIARQHVEHMATRGVSSPFVPDVIYRGTQEETLNLAKHVIRDNSKILDVGVGPGFLLEELEKTHPNCAYFGIDVSDTYLHRLQNLKPRWCVSFGDAEQIPYYDSCFDFVTCCDVLEHVLDVHKAMREVIRVLHPGGVAILRVPNDEDLTGYVDSKEFPFCHVRKFDIHSLSMLITKCHGQELIGCGPGQVVPSELYAVMRRPL